MKFAFNKENTKSAKVDSGPPVEVAPKGPKVKAAFVILAKNDNLEGIRSSIFQMEQRFNRKFNYPYVFLNDAEFTDEFKEWTSSLTKAKTFYGRVPKEHWGYPDFIDQKKAKECREDMAARNIIYGGSESYRHMCRFQSGFFFRHPLLAEYEYYWRIEPDINYYCDIDYDVFQMMKDNDYKYGWTISLTDYKATLPTLWSTVQKFFQDNPSYLASNNLYQWLLDDGEFNACHFWSNFEIGSLDFLRSKKYMDYFTALDRTGGFFYERWGDAPVHSIAVAMMLPKEKIHFFNDIGYYHGPITHCPTEKYLNMKCTCNTEKNHDWNGWSCMTRYLNLDPTFVWDEKTYNARTAPYRIDAPK
ncbi:glycosyltransferase family 15 protein [Gongronella butleri]|nr:glycosyltransferase family 15 protein [Gongronella butleri]